jgi:hypothetical protein
MSDDPEIDALNEKWHATRERVEREKRERFIRESGGAAGGTWGSDAE